MKEKIITLLKEINDPELDVSVWDLGLIYEIKVSEKNAVHIKMTLTAPGCPFMTQLVDRVKEEVGRLEGVGQVEVELVFDPPWGPERLTEAGRKKLGLR